jgi:hypothetical protein
MNSPVERKEDPRPKGQYRTSARVEMDPRKVLLRGGRYDGQIWVGVAAVGERVFCGGDDPWSMAGLYLVTALVEDSTESGAVNIAIPVLAG